MGYGILSFGTVAITNQTGGVITGAGGINATAGTVVNSGSIVVATSHVGVFLGRGSVTNNAGGTITNGAGNLTLADLQSHHAIRT